MIMSMLKVTLKTQPKHGVVLAAVVHAAMYRMKRYAVFFFNYNNLLISLHIELLMLRLQINKEI